jgi:hypothetical protein
MTQDHFSTSLKEKNNPEAMNSTKRESFFYVDY